MAHWDYVLREGAWMAEDFMQVREARGAASCRQPLACACVVGLPASHQALHAFSGLLAFSSMSAQYARAQGGCACAHCRSACGSKLQL